MPLSPLIIAPPDIMGEAGVRVRSGGIKLPGTFAEAGILVRDEIDTLYNRTPESRTINDTLDELEFFLMAEAPAPEPESISEHVKRSLPQL